MVTFERVENNSMSEMTSVLQTAEDMRVHGHFLALPIISDIHF
jgi:hypothetical protein